MATTRIRVPGGKRRVADLRIGDPVLAGDSSGNVSEERVLRTFRHRARPLLRLTTSVGQTLTTTGHPYFVPNLGFVAAGSLHAAMPILGFDNREATVTAVERLSATADVFNLEVSGAHTYFANEILVHNKSFPCPDCDHGLCAGLDLDNDGVPWEHDCDDQLPEVGACGPGEERAYVCSEYYASDSLWDGGVSTDGATDGER